MVNVVGHVVKEEIETKNIKDIIVGAHLFQPTI